MSRVCASGFVIVFYFINLGCFTNSPNGEEDLGEEKAGVHKGGADSDRDSSGSGSDPYLSLCLHIN